MTCCDLFDERYGCVHEICPACYCHKSHDQNVCDDCHAYNEQFEPYLTTYGPENVRKS